MEKAELIIMGIWFLKSGICVKKYHLNIGGAQLSDGMRWDEKQENLLAKSPGEFSN